MSRATTPDGSDTDPTEQWVHHHAGLVSSGSGSYIDSVILRDRDTTGDGTLDERVYYLQNWRADVVALITDTGAQVEQVRYEPYGSPFGIPAGDVDGSSAVNGTDVTAVTAWYNAPSYDVRGDLDMDGDIDTTDLALLEDAKDAAATLGLYQLSTVDNRKGYAGYELLAELSEAKWDVRNRVLNSRLGRWTLRDAYGSAFATNPSADADGIFNTQHQRALTIFQDHDQPGTAFASVSAFGASRPSEQSLCRARIERCDQTDAGVAALKVALTTNGCGIPPTRCKLCNSGQLAYYDGSKIVFCYNNLVGTVVDYCMAYRHELQHAVDRCNDVAQGVTCLDLACREVRAVHLSGQCCPSSPYYLRCRRAGTCSDYRSCVDFWAAQSARRTDTWSNQGCEDDAVVEAMNSRRCYDTRLTPCGGRPTGPARPSGGGIGVD